MLAAYLQDTRALLRDSRGLFTSTAQLTRWINEARKETAKVSGCLRTLVPGTAPFGNTSTPGLAVPGAFTPGSSDTSFQTIVGAEKYPFSYATTYIRQQNAGFDCIIDVIECSVSWGSVRPDLNWMPWEDLQAYARAYNIGVSSYPFYWSTAGDGENGQVWLFPVPSMTMEMEWDVTCTPLDLLTDSDFEPIPKTFTYAVKFYAAHLAYLSSGRTGQASIMLQMFMDQITGSRSASDRGKVPNYYWPEELP